MHLQCTAFGASHFVRRRPELGMSQRRHVTCEARVDMSSDLARDHIGNAIARVRVRDRDGRFACDSARYSARVRAVVRGAAMPGPGEPAR